MKKYFNPVSILYALTVLVSILFIFSIFSTLSDYDYTVFFNSDTLYLPFLYKDLFINHMGVQGWHLNPSPNFFPDMVVYFILMCLTKDFIVASFLYPLLQYIVFLVLIIKLYQLVLKSHSVLFASFSNLIFLLFFLVTFYTHDFDFTFYLISTSYHMGAFLLSFLCIILTIKYLLAPNKSLLINISWISSLGIISDRIFVVMYCIPILCIILLFKKIYPFRKIKLILIINISAFVLGAIIFILIQNTYYISIDRPYRIMDFKNARDSFHVLSGHLFYYMKYGTYTKGIIIASVLSFLSVLYLFLAGIRKESQLSAFTIYCFIAIAYTLFVFFAPVINGSYTASDSLRYNIYVFYISMLNIPLVIAYLLTRKSERRLFSMGISGLLIICILSAFWIGFSKLSISGLHKYFNYYPKKVEQIDKIAKEHQLFYGVGNYWSAKYISMFSKCGVNILPVFDDLHPYYHAYNKHYFFAKNNVFNFIILYKFVDKEKYKKILGSAGIIADSTQEIILLPKFRYDSTTLKPYLVHSTDLQKPGNQ